MLKSILLPVSILVSTGFSAMEMPSFMDKQVYLGMKDEFDAWDYFSKFPTVQDSTYNVISYEDSLFANYTPLLNEWDQISLTDSVTLDWADLTQFVDRERAHQPGALTEWDSTSFLKNGHQARSYNKWIIANTRQAFDLAKVRPWNPEFAPAYINPSSDLSNADLSISASPNPSLTGFVDAPLNLTVKLWSNQLAITPYRELFNPDRTIMSRFITETIKNTFSIKDSDSPEETTNKMKRRLKHDIHVNSRISYSPFAISGEHGNFGMSIFSDVGITIPGDLLGIAFGKTVEPGTSLDLTSLSAQAILGSKISIGGRSCRPLPKLLEPLLPTHEGWFWKQFNVDYITGFGYADVHGKKGTVSLDDEGTSYELNGEAEVYLAGTGVNGLYEFTNPFVEDGAFIWKPAGHGVGLDAGFEIADENRAIQLQFSNFGAMCWRNVQKGRVAITSDSLDIESMVNGAEAEDLITTTTDTLEIVRTLWRPLQSSISIGATQVLSRYGKRDAHGLYSRQLRAFGEYSQAITPYAGSSFVPRIKAGLENDFLMGAIGAGYYAILGGSERIGSGLTLRLFQNSKICVNTEYTAYGSPILFPKRGVAFSIVTRFNRSPEKWYK